VDLAGSEVQKEDAYFHTAVSAEKRTTSLPLDESTETFSYYFIVEQAFPLKIYVTRSYHRMWTNTRCLFNYRLYRA
jgi:hypothetical protein